MILYAFGIFVIGLITTPDDRLNNQDHIRSLGSFSALFWIT